MMDEAMKKTDATVLGIIYHPELRDISYGAKKNIAEMVRALSSSLAEPGYCAEIAHLEAIIENLEMSVRSFTDSWHI